MLKNTLAMSKIKFTLLRPAHLITLQATLAIPKETKLRASSILKIILSAPIRTSSPRMTSPLLSLPQWLPIPMDLLNKWASLHSLWITSTPSFPALNMMKIAPQIFLTHPQPKNLLLRSLSLVDLLSLKINSTKRWKRR